ncbi:MAG TPA: peptidase M23 [Micromonosporaceae bacterium]|nr:peptidase M23 [Micromonosporaceae bacterium]
MRVWRSIVAVLVALTASVAVIVIGPQPAMAAPNFKAPFRCGQRWTYSHHSAEVRLALDFIRNDGGTTNGSPVLASAGGTAYRYYQAGGAGNYIVIEHGGGWKTYYFHLSAFSVGHGAGVSQGQQIGLTGATGNVTGPHIHYEQLYNGVGQTIRINGVSLAPYPSSYGVKAITSDNGCGGSGTYFWTWGSGVRVRTDARLAAPVVATLAGPTYVKVICQKQGDMVTAEGYTNNWWSKLESPSGFMTNIYIDHPSAVLPGVPTC